MDASDSRSDLWQWHEYPVGLAGEVTHAFVRTLLPLLIAFGGTFVLVLGVGIMAEEGMFGDPGVANAVDALTLATLPMLMGGAFVVWGAYAVATWLRDMTTSRALVRATRGDADRQRVPAPEQIVAVVREPVQQLNYFVWGTGAGAALMGVIGIGISFTRDDDAAEVLTISGGALSWAAVMALLAFYVNPRLTAAHERRQKVIAACWSTDDEAKAWKRARPDRSQPRAVTVSFSRVDKMIWAATAVAALGFVLLQLSLGARCSAIPGASPGQQCDTTHYGSFLERLIGWGFSAFVVLMVIAILLAAGGALLEGLQRRTERRDLRRRMDDPTAERPDALVLAHHSGRQTHPIVTMMVALSAFGSVLGTAAYVAGTREESEVDIFYSPYQDVELAIVAASVALFVIALVSTALANASGRGFRNLLLQRWPTGPTWSAGEDGRVLRAMTGPALHAARYKKVGKGKSSQNAAPY